MELPKILSVGIIPVHRPSESEALFCVVRHAAGHWGFPKGHPNTGESLEETARRELREETGIEDIDLVLEPVFSEEYSLNDGGAQRQKQVKYFLGFTDTTAHGTPDDFKGEIPEVRWLLYAEAYDLLRESSKALLNEAVIYLKSRT